MNAFFFAEKQCNTIRRVQQGRRRGRANSHTPVQRANSQIQPACTHMRLRPYSHEARTITRCIQGCSPSLDQIPWSPALVGASPDSPLLEQATRVDLLGPSWSARMPSSTDCHHSCSARSSEVVAGVMMFHQSASPSLAVRAPWPWPSVSLPPYS